MLLHRVLPARSCPSFSRCVISLAKQIQPSHLSPMYLTASLPVPNPTPEGVAQVALALSLMQQTPLRCWLCQGNHGPWDAGLLHPPWKSQCSGCTPSNPCPEPCDSTTSTWLPQTILHRPIHRQAASSRGHLLPGFQDKAPSRGKWKPQETILGGNLQKAK